MLPYPDTKPFHGMNRYTGEKDFFEKRIFPVPEGEGGMHDDSAGSSGVADARVHCDLRGRRHHVEDHAVH